MPVEGLPDPGRHRACIRCAKWFEPAEGSLTLRERVGIAGGIADSIRSSAGEADVRFICNRCASVRRSRRIILYVILGLAMVWAAAKDAGWL